MTDDEIEMIKSVIRTSANTDEVIVRRKKTNWAQSAVFISLKDQKTEKYVDLYFDDWVPDVPHGADAAAQMLAFMFNEDTPKRAATFFDYIAMAYELGKQYRWT